MAIRRPFSGANVHKTRQRLAEAELSSSEGAHQMTRAIEDIIAERVRQQEMEGWSAKHDDEHIDGELCRAAAFYAANAGHSDRRREEYDPSKGGRIPLEWPWHASWWKPKDRRRDLVRAGALIVAEIERLDRIEVRQSAASPTTQEDRT